jgi:glutamine synthetase
VGPALGVEAGDHLWIARYLSGRVAEDFNISISFAPKLFKDWNGAGCHTNYSTKDMREGKDGIEYIHKLLNRLGTKH